MGEVTLRNGKVIIVDVSEMTVSEWRDFATSRGSIKGENEVIAKCTGLTIKEIEALNYRAEFKPLVKAIIEAAQSPLADPN